jgi:hypothetical protein
MDVSYAAASELHKVPIGTAFISAGTFLAQQGFANLGRNPPEEQI